MSFGLNLFIRAMMHNRWGEGRNVQTPSHAVNYNITESFSGVGDVGLEVPGRRNQIISSNLFLEAKQTSEI